MYIFGKFDTFCRRLNEIIDVLETFERFSSLQRARIPGIEQHASKYAQIVHQMRKKPYNPLDHRKADFENDYEEMRKQFRDLEVQLQAFMDTAFRRVTATMLAIELLGRFRKLQLPCLNTRNKLYHVYLFYGADLDNLKRRFVDQHEHPPTPKTLPPVGGACDWARHLQQRIAEPMEFFEKYPYLFKTSEGERIYANYMTFRKVLTTYEQRYYDQWEMHLAQIKPALKATVFARRDRDPDKELVVNLDPWLYQ